MELMSSTISKGKRASAVKVPADFDSRDQKRMKLQPLGDFTDSEGKENFGSTRTASPVLKNESLADTDTMGPTALEENPSSGPTLSLSNKGHQNSLSSQAAPAREVIRDRLLCNQLPDINQVPEHSDASSMDGEASSLRTQSLDAKHLLTHGKPFEHSDSIAISDAPLVPDQSSKWVRRFKFIDSPYLAHGTKCSILKEPSQGNAHNVLHDLMEVGVTVSESMLDNFRNKEQVAFYQNTVVVRKGESSSAVKEGEDNILSCSWIKRWCHNLAATPRTMPEPVVVCEPQSSVVMLHQFQERQFPSITAMALMGKAMRCSTPCEFRKNGSFVDWNA